MQKRIRLLLVLLFAALPSTTLFATPPCPTIWPGVNVNLVFAGTECGISGGQCAPGETLMFAATTTNLDSICGMLTFHWDFGDGATSDAKETAHAYAAPGTYRVELIVTEGTPESAQSAMLLQDITVAPLAAPPPLPFDFTVQRMIAVGAVSANGYICTAAPTRDGVTETRMQWDFGDGTTALAGWRVTHIYADAVPHVVTLTVVGFSGSVQHTAIPARHRPARH